MPAVNEYTQTATITIDRDGLDYVATFAADAVGDLPAWTVTFTWPQRGKALLKCLALARHQILQNTSDEF